MNGDTWTVVVAVIAMGVALGGMSFRHGVKLGGISRDVKDLLGTKEHVDDIEHRLTVLKTEHDCCPQCSHEGAGQGE